MAAQQLNLMHPGLRPVPVRYSARQLAWVCAGLVALTALAVVTTRHLAAQSAGRAQQFEQQSEGLRTRQAAMQSDLQQALRHPESELRRLRQQEQAQRLLRDALASGEAGRAEGYSEVLLALARQTQPALWLTGFEVSDKGETLEITGRMFDAAALPEYLRKLHAEPVFRGRRFVRLGLKTVVQNEPGLPPIEGLVEFTLRSPGVDATAAEAPR
jgi:hypothetical protein